jgi:hypothetical protein
VCSACVHPAFLGYLRDLWFHRNNNLRRINRAGQFESLSLRHRKLHLFGTFLPASDDIMR